MSSASLNKTFRSFLSDLLQCNLHKCIPATIDKQTPFQWATQVGSSTRAGGGGGGGEGGGMRVPRGSDKIPSRGVQ